jgi:hypothetical protein
MFIPMKTVDLAVAGLAQISPVVRISIRWLLGRRNLGLLCARMLLRGDCIHGVNQTDEHNITCSLVSYFN